jgi:hypothetical protein
MSRFAIPLAVSGCIAGAVAVGGLTPRHRERPIDNSTLATRVLSRQEQAQVLLDTAEHFRR